MSVESLRPVVMLSRTTPPWPAKTRNFVDSATCRMSLAEAGAVLLRGLVGAQVGPDFNAPAPRSAFEDVRVMEQPIEERGDGGRVAEELAPVVDRSV